MTVHPMTKGTPVTVVAGHGGSYAPGRPREPLEYVQNYLTAVLSEPSAWRSTSSELTMAPHDPR